MATPFSFACLDSITGFIVQSPRYLKASDGIDLAYYEFAAEKPDAVMVFYHGGGAWSNILYQRMATDLASQSNVITYLFDIRGHGHSQGSRGDAPSIKQVWRDITIALEFAAETHPGLPILLGGHSSGAGLLVNYACWNPHSLASGYVLLAPFWGVQYGMAYEHTDLAKRFVKDVRLFPLITSAITHGWFFAHTPVIFFNYPVQEKQKDSLLLEYYTSNMALAVTPHHDPKKFFATLEKPMLLLIGECDEQFIPEKIMQYAEGAAAVQGRSMARIVYRATHLSIVLEASAYIKEWLQQRAI